MLKGLIDFSLRNKFIVLLTTLGLSLGGIYALLNLPLDAIPDLSDVQVIIYTEWPGQAPQIVQDQVTYPITTKMLSMPKAKVVRGYSFYGFSFVYVIFADGTDPYWARSRVLEYLSSLGGRLPRGVSPSLGPDATGVGWAFMYSLNSTNRSLAELRSIQDWYLRYQLASVEGVSEVASVDARSNWRKRNSFCACGAMSSSSMICAKSLLASAERACRSSSARWPTSSWARICGAASPN